MHLGREDEARLSVIMWLAASYVLSCTSVVPRVTSTLFGLSNAIYMQFLYFGWKSDRYWVVLINSHLLLFAFVTSLVWNSSNLHAQFRRLKCSVNVSQKALKSKHFEYWRWMGTWHRLCKQLCNKSAHAARNRWQFVKKKERAMMRKCVKACQNCQNTSIQIRSASKGVA